MERAQQNKNSISTFMTISINFGRTSRADFRWLVHIFISARSLSTTLDGLLGDPPETLLARGIYV